MALTVRSINPSKDCYFFRINHPTCKSLPGFFETAVCVTALHGIAFVLTIGLLVKASRKRLRSNKSNNPSTTSSDGGFRQEAPSTSLRFTKFELFLSLSALGLFCWTVAHISSLIPGGSYAAVGNTFTGVGTVFYYHAIVVYVDLVLKSSPDDDFWTRQVAKGGSKFNNSPSVARKNWIPFIRKNLLKIGAPVITLIWLVGWVAGGVLNDLTNGRGLKNLMPIYQSVTLFTQLFLIACWLYLLIAVILARRAWLLNIEKAKSIADVLGPQTLASPTSGNDSARQEESIVAGYNTPFRGGSSSSPYPPLSPNNSIPLSPTIFSQSPHDYNNLSAPPANPSYFNYDSAPPMSPSLAYHPTSTRFPPAPVSTIPYRYVPKSNSSSNTSRANVYTKLMQVLYRGKRTLDIMLWGLSVFILFSFAFAVFLLLIALSGSPDWPPYLFYLTLFFNYSLGMLCFVGIMFLYIGQSIRAKFACGRRDTEVAV